MLCLCPKYHWCHRVKQDFCPEIAVSLLSVSKKKKKKCNVYPRETRLFQVSDSLLIFTCCALLTAVPANSLLPLNGSCICSVAAEHRCLLIQKATQIWGSARCFLNYFVIVCAENALLKDTSTSELLHRAFESLCQFLYSPITVRQSKQTDSEYGQRNLICTLI